MLLEDLIEVEEEEEEEEVNTGTGTRDTGEHIFTGEDSKDFFHGNIIGDLGFSFSVTGFSAVVDEFESWDCGSTLTLTARSFGLDFLERLHGLTMARRIFCS